MVENIDDMIQLLVNIRYWIGVDDDGDPVDEEQRELSDGRIVNGMLNNDGCWQSLIHLVFIEKQPVDEALASLGYLDG